MQQTAGEPTRDASSPWHAVVREIVRGTSFVEGACLGFDDDRLWFSTDEHGVTYGVSMGLGSSPGAEDIALANALRDQILALGIALECKVDVMGEYVSLTVRSIGSGQRPL